MKTAVATIGLLNASTAGRAKRSIAEGGVSHPAPDADRFKAGQIDAIGNRVALSTLECV